MPDRFIPEGFTPPAELVTEHTVLRPLGPDHNEADYEAWSTSIEHIRATPGYGPDARWPTPMSLDENLRDLEMHARHFADREGFTYTVLDRSDAGTVLGCVYIYPSPDAAYDARVRSWVRATRPELDREVWEAVTGWLKRDWPFDQVEYATR